MMIKSWRIKKETKIQDNIRQVIYKSEWYTQNQCLKLFKFWGD